MPSLLPRRCANCYAILRGKPDNPWCDKCAKAVKAFTVHLGERQQAYLESLAHVRNESTEEVLRAALDLLSHRTSPVNPLTIRKRDRKPKH
jgi:hypothetical protein